MRWHAFLVFLFSCFSNASDFTFPTNISEAKIPEIVQTFNSGFLIHAPVSLLGQSQYNSQLAFHYSTIDTTKIARMGTTSKAKEVQIKELSFSKQLPFNVEVGLQTSLTIFDRDVNKFGGYFRWGFKNYSWGNFSIFGHGSSAGYKNLIGTNLYGGLLNLDMNVWAVHVSLGTGLVRTTNTFDATLFGSTGSDPDRTYGRSYAHQSAKVAYVWNNFAISAQGDWLREFFSSFDLTYLF